MPPSRLATDFFQGDRPATAHETPSLKVLQTRQGKLRRRPNGIHIAVIERVVGMQIGEKKEQGQPAPEELRPGARAELSTIEISDRLQSEAGVGARRRNEVCDSGRWRTLRCSLRTTRPLPLGKRLVTEEGATSKPTASEMSGGTAFPMSRN